MRKLLASLSLATLLLVLVSTSVLAGGVIKVGADVGGESEIKVTAADGTSVSVNDDTKTGISIGGEYFFDLNESLAVGAGVEYQLTRKNEGAEIGFNFIPLYALGRYHISQDFYLTGKIGYNLLQFEENPDGAKPKGGLYYGFGGGLIFSDRYQLEILYSIHNGRFEPEEDPGVDYKVTYKYSKIGLTVGYKF